MNHQPVDGVMSGWNLGSMVGIPLANASCIWAVIT